MTVAGETGIAQRIWRGYDDPGLPVGMYRALTSVTGDMSGGNMLITFIYRNLGDSLTGRFYNIEQLEVNRTGSPTNGFLQSENFETVGPTGLINFERRIRLDASGGSFVNAMNPGESVKLPLFLGSSQAVPALAAEVNIGFANTNLLVLVASIQGYIWESRSIMAEGGLRRPQDSLYGGGL